jgi:cytosine/adenosine deaminase-related metal-dependent hydrolase
VAILPGLINAHTHLEFSHLESPLGTPGMEFADWIRLVVEHRRQRTSPVEDARRHSSYGIGDSIAAGLAECAAGGATHIGEVAVPREAVAPYDEYAAVASHVTVFHEMIGLPQQRVGPLMDGARRHLQRLAGWGQAVRPGLSPHAPYTVHPDLVDQVARLSARERVPVAMHLAESFAEKQLLSSHGGPLVELLREMEVWDPAAVPRGIRPLDYLRQLAPAHRTLIVHGNFLDREEIDLLAARAETMSLVYCPRTHDYFDHGDYGLAERLSAGVNVCLGTDSRASNPDLSLLAEMRHVARHQAGVAPAAILEMATRAAARALGLDGQTGCLEEGNAADLTLLRLPEHTAGDPYELLFDPVCVVEAIYRGGRRAG